MTGWEGESAREREGGCESKNTGVKKKGQI